MSEKKDDLKKLSTADFINYLTGKLIGENLALYHAYMEAYNGIVPPDINRFLDLIPKNEQKLFYESLKQGFKDFAPEGLSVCHQRMIELQNLRDLKKSIHSKNRNL